MLKAFCGDFFNSRRIIESYLLRWTLILSLMTSGGRALGLPTLLLNRSLRMANDLLSAALVVPSALG